MVARRSHPPTSDGARKARHSAAKKKRHTAPAAKSASHTAALSTIVARKVALIWLSGMNTPPPKAKSSRAKESSRMTFSVGSR